MFSLGVVLVLGFTVCCAYVEDDDGYVKYRYICPDEFKQIGKRCYHFSNSSATWFQAYYKCNLTILTERYDLRSLEQYFSKKRDKSSDQEGSSFWIAGIKDWKQNKWLWYTTGKTVRFPSNIVEESQNQEWICLSFNTVKRKWIAKNCMTEMPYICQTDPKAHIAFRIVDTKFRRKISIDKCISDVENLSIRQRMKCDKILKTKYMHPNEPAAVIQRPLPTNPSKRSKIINHICPQNWISLGKKCYRLSKDALTWSEAYYSCDQNNSKLAVIKSRVQDFKLRMLLTGFTDKKDRWIGGMSNGRKGEWKWAQSGQLLGYKGFAKEIQSNMTLYLKWHEAAIMMDPRYDYQWNYSNIMDKKFYICQVKGKSVKQITTPRKPDATIVILHGNRKKSPK